MFRLRVTVWVWVMVLVTWVVVRPSAAARSGSRRAVTIVGRCILLVLFS